MNKNYKPINNSFREHYHLHGHLSPTMIEELLDLVDDLERDVDEVEHEKEELRREIVYLREQVELREQLLTESEESADYWRNLARLL